MNGIKNVKGLYEVINAIVEKNGGVVKSSDLALSLFKADVMGGSTPTQLQRRFLEIFDHCRTDKGIYDLSKFDEAKIPVPEGKTPTTVVDGKEKIQKLIDNLTLVAEKAGYKLNVKTPQFIDEYRAATEYLKD